MSHEPNTDPSRRRRRQWIAGSLATAAVVLLGSGVLYGTRGAGKDGAPSCSSTAATVARITPLLHGEVAGFSPSRLSDRVSDLSFTAEGGAAKTLADFKGRTVLLNLWATWCAPCRTEMPALDRLQADLGGPDFEVVAVNLDQQRLDLPKRFLNEIGAKHLAFYADPTFAVFQSLHGTGAALGLPTTVLVDRNGCTIATLAGPADWASEDARKLIDAAKAS